MARAILASLLGLLLIGGWVLPTWQAAAQNDVQVVIERPRAGVPSSTSLEVTGYAYNPAATSGSGIDAVHVYMDGEPGQRNARFLGEASFGLRRPDLAQRDPRLATSGWSLLVDVSPGNHALYVYAHLTGSTSDDGWVRASIPAFEASLVTAGPTMVQPGPAPVGADDGRYRTGQASLQGGGTCTRYNGRGECEQSVPFGVASGASCIQWNQRGQCTSYLPAEGASMAGSSGNSSVAPAPTRAAPAQPELLRVPAAGSSGVVAAGGTAASSGSNPSAIRAVAPPPADGSAQTDGGVPAPAAAAPPPPDPNAATGGAPTVRAAPAPPDTSTATAPPPPASTGGTIGTSTAGTTTGGTIGTSTAGTAGASTASSPGATTGGALAPPVQTTAANQPPPSIDPNADTSIGNAPNGDPIPLAPITGSSAVAAPAPAPSGGSGHGSMVAMGEAGEAFAPPEGYRAVESASMPAAPVAPQVVATQSALQGGGGTVQSAGSVSGLRSGCALYLGCGNAAPAANTQPTATATPQAPR